WWGALTQQFSQLAANAMKEGATDAAKKLAGSVITQSLDAAGQTLKKAMPRAAAVSGKAAATPHKRAGARARRS
ncbi:MAG: PhaM family polyhydroxyalkanoate granule multifunctional regulatory protein, partial [Caldimonas sp.]